MEVRCVHVVWFNNIARIVLSVKLGCLVHCNLPGGHMAYMISTVMQAFKPSKLMSRVPR